MRQKKKRRKILPIVLFVMLVLAISAGVGILYKYKPTNEIYDSRQYYGITQGSQAALIIDQERLDEYGLVRDGVVYIAYDLVLDYINDRFYWEETLSEVRYVLPEEMVSHQVGDGVLVQDDTVYLSIDLISQYTPISVAVYEDPYRVVMDTATVTYTSADVKKTQSVRYRGGVKSPILTEVEEGASVRVLEEGEDWDKVLTEDGYIGYIQKKYLTDRQEETLTLASRDEGYTSLTKDTVINLVWHQVTSSSQNDELAEKLASVTGVNVISPTWFYLTGSAGEVSSLADSDYVAYAHEQGYEVWALVDNFTEDVDTGAILSDPTAREHLINTLVNDAVQYGIDGLNIDFEELASEEGPAFVQFIRELSLRCHENNLILSVDNHVPYDYNSFYNRSEQAVFADYLILMSYDEHLNESTGEGSVASIDYVTGAIDRMLEEVPKEKLINAIPFYTRIWKEIPASDSSGTYSLSWDTLGIASAWNTINQRGVALTWDEETMQYYGEYTLEDGTVCKVWMEEETSIEEKLKVMQERELAGVACWKLGLETDSLWTVISAYYAGK